MYDSLMIWRVPMTLIVGFFAGWFGARNELRIARDSDKSRGAGLLLRMRALQYALSFYLIFSILGYGFSGLYAARFWQALVPARGSFANLMPASIQTLATGALIASASSLHFIEAFAEKYDIDLW